MAAPAAAISCRRRLLSPSPLRSKPSASTARYSRLSPTPRPISNCSGRCRLRPPARRTTSRAFALRLRPNQDFAGALEAFCRERGIVSAKIHGGVGSTIGVRFADGRIVEPFATELAIRAGVIAAGAGGALEAELDIAACRLHRRPRRGPAEARRQSGADDDGAGAGSGGGRRLVARFAAGQVVAALRSPPKFRKQPHAQIGWVSTGSFLRYYVTK